MNKRILVSAFFAGALGVFSHTAVGNAAVVAGPNLAVAIEGYSKIKTVDDLTRILSVENSPEAVRAIQTNLQSEGVTGETRLPTIVIRDHRIVVGDKATFKILSEVPLKISYEGRIWTYDSAKGLDQNIVALQVTMRAAKSAGWHVLLGETAFADADLNQIAADATKTAAAAIPVALAAVMVGSVAAISAPVWLVVGGAVAVGYGLVRGVDALLSSSDRYQCEDGGVTMDGVLHVSGDATKVTSATYKSGRYSKAVTLPLNEFGEARLKVIKEVLRLCREDKPFIAKLNADAKAKLSVIGRASSGNTPVK